MGTSEYSRSPHAKVVSLVKNNKGIVLIHLAEGRRDDHASRMEFQFLKLVGLVRPNVHIVHATAMGFEDYLTMAAAGMHLIWSPFSNFILYGETTDILKAHQAGLKIALGTDWTPTGTKGLLDELQIARDYIISRPELRTVFDDHEIYKMVTENPAWMIGRLNNEHPTGVIRVGAMANIIALTHRSMKMNPYTNFVTSREKHVNLSLIDGKPVYGNRAYLEGYYASLGTPEPKFESMPFYRPALNKMTHAKLGGLVPLHPKASEKERLEHPIFGGRAIVKETVKPEYSRVLDYCNFSPRKAFVVYDSEIKLVHEYHDETGLDLDSPLDLHKLLASYMLTQTYNAYPAIWDRNTPKFGPEHRPEVAISVDVEGRHVFEVGFPPLYRCNDLGYDGYIENFVDTFLPDYADEQKRLRRRKEFNL